MIDFREYIQVNDINEQNLEFDYGYDEDEFDNIWESPFSPIEVGKYKIHIHASEEHMCNPMVNSIDPYIYTEWELMIEESHSRYDMAVVTSKIMKEMGIMHPDDSPEVTVPMVPVEVIQIIFEHLIDKLYLPKIDGVLPSKKQKNK